MRRSVTVSHIKLAEYMSRALRPGLWAAAMAGVLALSACGGGGGSAGIASASPVLAEQIRDIKPSDATDTVSVFVQLGSSNPAAGVAAVGDDAAQRQQLQSQFLADLQRVVVQPAAGAATSTTCDAEALKARIAKAFSPKSGAAVRIELSACELDLLPAIPNVKGVHVDIPLALSASAADTLALEVKRVFDGTTAWRINGQTADGAGKVIAVIDTGVESQHPALRGKVLPGACFSTSGAGSVGLCPNGQSADTTSAGAGGSCASSRLFSSRSAAIQAGCGHGTSMAGVAAMDYSATSRSSLDGGVAKTAQILPIQVFSQQTDSGMVSLGSTSGDLLAALEWLDQQADKPEYKGKIVAVNMSLGGRSFASACDGEYLGGLFKNVFASLRAKGVLPVVAAGNDGNRAGVSFPACVSNAIQVAASRLNHAGLASYSNFSAQVKVIAPGGDVDGSGRYAMPAVCQWSDSFDCWQAAAGTSPATAMVSGAVAALSTVAPNASTAQIEAALTTDLTGSLSSLAKTLTESSSGLTRPALRVTASAYSLLGLSDPGTTPPAPTPQPTPTPQPPVQSYTVGGTVSGLTAGNSLTLLNNNTDTLSVRSLGPDDVMFEFKTRVTAGYDVTVGAQPSGQTCTVANGSGTAQGPVTSVRITCTTNTSGDGTGDQAGACVRYANDVVVCSGQATRVPEPPALPSYQLCVYSAPGYTGRQACVFWNGIAASKYIYGDLVRSVRVRAVSFNAETGKVEEGADVNESGVFRLTVRPLSSRRVIVLSSSSPDITSLLPENARVRALKIERP